MSDVDRNAYVELLNSTGRLNELELTVRYGASPTIDDTKHAGHSLKGLGLFGTAHSAKELK